MRRQSSSRSAGDHSGRLPQRRQGFGSFRVCVGKRHPLAQRSSIGFGGGAKSSPRSSNKPSSVGDPFTWLHPSARHAQVASAPTAGPLACGLASCAAATVSDSSGSTRGRSTGAHGAMRSGSARLALAVRDPATCAESKHSEPGCDGAGDLDDDGIARACRAVEEHDRD